jgi:trigger factor
MQVSIESTEGLERRMTVELPPERVEPEFEKRLKEMARHVRMDGFRPGKVPLRMVRQRYGRQVREEIYGELVRQTYFEALSQEQIHPVGEPRIEVLDKDKGMGYTATFEVMPELKVGDLSSAEITRSQAEITDADVDKMIRRLREQRAEWEETDRASTEGDRLTISFVGKIGGEEFEGGSANDVPLTLGSGAMIDGFESGLTGVKAGEEKTLEVKFPDDYKAEKLAGKDATFDVSVSKVEAPLLPEIDDEFCKAFGVEEGGKEALLKDVRTNMERELRDRIRTQVKNQVMDALIASTPVDVPAAMVTEECKALREQARQNLGQNAQAQKFELPLEIFEDQAKKRVAIGLIIAQIVKENEIKVDADKVKQRIAEMAESFENPQEVIDYYESNPQQRSSVEGLVLEEQVVDWVLEQAKVEDEVSDFYSIMNPGQS